LSAEEGPASPERIHVVLYQPEIAANTGAIGRTCVAAGAVLWLVRPLGFHLDDRNRRRAGLDYWEHLDLRVVDSLDEVASSPEVGRLWLFTTKGKHVYTSVSFQPGDALVFGPESRGLPDRLLAAHPDDALVVPMHPEARSLNLSSAVAIGTYEALRQVSGRISPILPAQRPGSPPGRPER
jgi:tRNA (cytidine/uridine-2'-O-)-methyltransferase